MENKPNKSVRYATYYWAWKKPFSLMTHGAEQHGGRRNKMFVEQYCQKQNIKPILEFTDHINYKEQNYDELPGLNGARSAGHARKYDVLIIMRFSEVSKNTRGLVNFVGELLKNDINIHCINRPFTTYFNDGRLIICPDELEET
ncbi:MAG: recombinase family protein [Patescibacteria group bacterium]